MPARASHHIKVTDDLSYEEAERQLLVLMDESERGEDMRRLYHYMRSCDDIMKDCANMLRDVDLH